MVSPPAMIVILLHAPLLTLNSSLSALGVDKHPKSRYNRLADGVWRSLVSRLVRVQETSGSNPDTPTIENSTANGCFAVLFLYL